MSYRRAFDIAGYTYQADIYCPWCVVELLGQGGDCMSDDPNKIIEAVAVKRGIDTSDLRNYDSGDFPKPVFVSQIEDAEVCASCWMEIS